MRFPFRSGLLVTALALPFAANALPARSQSVAQTVRGFDPRDQFGQGNIRPDIGDDTADRQRRDERRAHRETRKLPKCDTISPQAHNLECWDGNDSAGQPVRKTIRGGGTSQKNTDKKQKFIFPTNFIFPKIR